MSTIKIITFNMTKKRPSVEIEKFLDICNKQHVKEKNFIT